MLGAEIDRGDTFAPDENEGKHIIELEGELNPDLLAIVAGEDETDPDEVVPPADEVVPEPAKSERTIPKPRFDEIYNENKALKAENEQLRATSTLISTEAPIADGLYAELDELQTKINDALMNGDMEEMAGFQKEANKVNRQIAKEEIRIELEQSRQQERVAATLNEAAAEAYEQFPFLDIDAPDHNPKAISMVLAMRDKLAATGIALPAALRQAVADFAEISGLKPATTDTGKAADVRKAREAVARAKAAGASLSQPAPHTSGEKESFKVDISTLSPSEFDKLPESVKAKARGDYV